MKLLTKDIQKQLLANEQKYMARGADTSFPDSAKVPVRLFGFTQDTDWYIISGTPEEGSPFADHEETTDGKDWMLYGLCDLGMGFPELGSVWLGELKDLEFPPFGLGVERDRHYEGTWGQAKESKGLLW